MIIKANTPTGQKTQVYNADGSKINLPITEYNTETKEAKIYEKVTDKDGNGRYKVANNELVLQSVVLNGSYAEVDGERV